MTIAKESKRILNVTVKRVDDYDADNSSYLGEFSMNAGEYAIAHVGEYAGQFVDELPCECTHQEGEHNKGGYNDGECTVKGCECNDFDRVEVRGDSRWCSYFNPNADNYKDEPDADIRKYCQRDYARMRGLGDEWGYVGVVAEAQVKLNGDLVQTITSGGLWGIESDSGDSYFREVEGEQLDELRTQLQAIGFSKRAVVAAFRDVEHVERG